MKVTILWNAGWDDIEIDPATTREATQEEIEAYTQRVERGWGGDPWIGRYEWVWAPFLRGYQRELKEAGASFSTAEGKTTLVKVVRRIASGD